MKHHRRVAPSSPLSSAFTGFRFSPEVIVLAVLWYLRFGCHTETWKNSSLNAASKWTTSPCIGGYSGSHPC
jgi:hypothetical protein